MIATRVIAHRGDSSEAPENTVPSFDAALQAGADAIEVDLQLTADGVVVVIHDDLLDRTTDSVGAVGELDARAVLAADAGSWFAPAFAGTRVPTLDALIEWAVGAPGMGWLLEFKGPWSELSVAPVLAQLRASGVAGRAVVQSFDLGTVRALRAAGPDFRVEALVFELPAADGVDGVDGVDARIERLVEVLREVGAEGCNPYGVLLAEHPQLADALHSAGFTVTPWTLDEPEHWVRAVEAGVDAIITNRPGVLRAWLEAKPA
ncbi:glycerophosphodiester phosphodiesterase [Subtercola sp. RTI3]|uniref:glycerophosphodiester phosphodiesterase n=1 Tax=Subtercola sp. RTI3 TaxID=3048639 RepID=UPI002B238C16|nr:glycerophosphodiester phosphodiesterase [Subtercola sp. RTI3]MEA9987149.1 glycerophosphodiester phosphodiesterase [Subtercola sp. RTI3]